jgi:L-alanine-DL-glutamate epimerase-like enolase superfamily enzyme
MSNDPRLTWERYTLKLRNPFRLSYGVSEERHAFIVRLENGAGWGEGTIPPYYGVAQEDMIACWQAASEKKEPFPDEPSEIFEWVGLSGPAPARCALELALYDRIARQRGIPLYSLLELPKPEPKPTSFTIAIAEPEEMAKMALQIPDYPVIKVKLGSDDDHSRLAAIRAARPDVRLRVDANAGWSREDAVRHLKEFDRYNLEMVEQPLEKHDHEGMGYVQKHTSVPVVADESVQTIEDVEKLAAAGVQGINLKLMKVGGLTPGLRMLRRARELGMRVMLGCMVETSLGTTAMAHLSGMAEWLDLDAPMLITNDPFDGLQYDQYAVVSVPERPGIGAELKK